MTYRTVMKSAQVIQILKLMTRMMVTVMKWTWVVWGVDGTINLHLMMMMRISKCCWFLSTLGMQKP